MILKCVNNGCGYELQPNWKNCPACGSPAPKLDACNQCGNRIELNWKVCPNCSNPIGSEVTSTLGVTDATVGTLNQSVTNITYANSDQNPDGTLTDSDYCRRCGILISSDKHFLCTNCKKQHCLDCRSPSGQCFDCNPLKTPSAPLALKVKIDRHDATISWSKPITDGGKPITGYVIGIKENQNFSTTVTNTTQVVIPDIPEGGPYTFIVNAVNDIGEGPNVAHEPLNIVVPYCQTCKKVLTENHFLCSKCNEKSCLDCRSPKGPCLSCNPFQIPDSPRNVKVEVEVYNAEVSWDEPNDDGGKVITEYIVTIPEIVGKSFNLEIGRYNKLKKILIEEIPEGGPYTANVIAANELGTSEPGSSTPFNIILPHCDLCNSSIKEVTVCPKCDGNFGQECMTQSGSCNTCHGKSLPGPPVSLETSLLPRNTDDVVVEWKAPEDIGESPITQYIVKCIQDSSIRITVDVGSFKQIQNKKYTRFCVACAAENTSDLQFCTGCGNEHDIDSSNKRETNIYSALVHKLKIGKTFSFTVSAVNRNGEGPSSEPSDPLKLTGQKLHPLVARLRPGVVITIAGNGEKGFAGDGNIGNQASLNEPYDVAVDELGNIYIADSGNNRIRKVFAETGIIDTEVGNGKAEFSGDGSHPKQASLQNPRGVDFDSVGNLYIADTDNFRIRKVDSASREITTIAGNGANGNQGDGLKATQSQLANPESVSVDNHTGYIYISGEAAGARKKVRFIDDKNIIRNIAGSDKGIKPQNSTTANQAEFSTTGDLVIQSDHSGGVFIGEQNGNRLYYVASEFNKDNKPNGSINTVAGTGSNTYTNNEDGGQAIEAGLCPQGLTYHQENNTLYINDGGSIWLGNKRIRKIDLDTGIVTTIAGNGNKGYAGDGMLAHHAEFNKPRGLAVDSYGNLYIADADNNRIRVVRIP